MHTVLYDHANLVFVLIFPRSLSSFTASLSAFELDMYVVLCMQESTCFFNKFD